MKKLLLAILASAAFGGAAMAQSSGTDQYGYTWRTSGTAGGPTYDWVDISSTGTSVSGLADDNFMGPIPIGFDFTYYWLNYNQVYVGSNGFISFGQGYNLASGQVGATGNGFNNLPYNENPPLNNMIAPFLADLTFVGTSGPVATAKVYYQTIGTRFIVSYEHVPYWTDETASNTRGDNSFQVILDNVDSSITIQYRACTNGADAAYTAWLVRGFENINGNMGATISTGGSASNNSLPTAQSAVKIKYPATPLVQTTDVRVAGVFNADNAAEFLYKGSATSLRALVQNSGATAITSAFEVRAAVQDATGTVIHRDTVSVPRLNRNQTLTVTFPNALPSTTAAGSYTVAITSFLTGDGNLGNDLAETELVIVDTAAAVGPIYELGYDTKSYPQAAGQQGFDNQNGGVYIKPPSYPARLVGIQFDMAWTDLIVGNGDSTLNSRFLVLKDDGANGAPNTWISEWQIDSTYYTKGDSIGVAYLAAGPTGPIRRYNLYLPTAYTINSGGVYLGMFNDQDRNFFWNSLMRDLTPPFSSRTYEAPLGAWAPHRNNGQFDYALRALFSETLVSNKPKSATESLRVSPNPAATAIRLVGMTGKTVTMMNASGQVVKTVSAVNGLPVSINLNGMSKGIYTLRTDSGQVARFVKE